MEVGYPKKWIEVVMTEVTSVRTNVKWNGVRADFFHLQRGIRQGEPISPWAEPEPGLPGHVPGLGCCDVWRR
jgi:hypothetical protein